MTADLDKFEEFMRNYQDMVYGTALRLLGQSSDAQDIAQTVFLKAFESFSSLVQSPTAGGWLKRVTTNLCLNQLTRYRYRWRFFSELRSHDDEPDFAETVAAPDRHEAGLDESDHRRLLETALQRLSATQRVPLVLYHFDDLSYEEIARRLGISLSKVKTDIHRGRLALQRYLRPSLAGDDRFGGSSAGSGQAPAASNTQFKR
jgi:RNA polymerase sigma-70 factor (ECF subfamily)